MNIIDLATPKTFNNYVKSQDFRTTLEKVVDFLKTNGYKKDDTIELDILFHHLGFTKDAQKELLKKSLDKVFCIRDNMIFQDVSNIMDNYLAKYDQTNYLLNKLNTGTK